MIYNYNKQKKKKEKKSNNVLHIYTYIISDFNCNIADHQST